VLEIASTWGLLRVLGIIYTIFATSQRRRLAGDVDSATPPTRNGGAALMWPHKSASARKCGGEKPTTSALPPHAPGRCQPNPTPAESWLLTETTSFLGDGHASGSRMLGAVRPQCPRPPRRRRGWLAMSAASRSGNVPGSSPHVSYAPGAGGGASTQPRRWMGSAKSLAPLSPRIR